MLIIDQDPNISIPRISEYDFHNKIIIAEVRRSSEHYIDIAIKDDNEFQWKGHDITGHSLYHTMHATTLLELLCKNKRNPLLMRFTHAEHDSLCEAIINTYNYNTGTFRVRFYIFENSHEIFEYMKGKGIL